MFSKIKESSLTKGEGHENHVKDNVMTLRLPSMFL